MEASSADLPPPEGRPDLLIVAGEHSGDEHAAALVEDLLARKPDWQIEAMGGPRLEEAGARLLIDMTAFSVVGLVEVLRHYNFFKELMEETISWIAHYRPRCVLLVDYPGFNLRLAKELHKLGIASTAGGPLEVRFYIAPQVWAWKKHRRFHMAEWLDALAVIFPFEVETFADTKLATTFVGHPYVRPGFELPVTYDPIAPVLLLPGSRVQAVTRIAPILIEAFSQFARRHPSARARLLHPGGAVQAALEEALDEQGSDASIELVHERSQACIEASAMLTSSGTMSLKCALAGIPGAIVYRAHPLTWWLGRRLVDLNYIGMANLLLDKPAWPEYLQDDALPEALSEELAACVQDRSRREEAQAHARALREQLLGAQCSPADWLLAD